jgi:hypothetical protein
MVDWSQYDDEMSPWISGASLDFDVKRLTEECNDSLGLVCQYVAAFYDGDDEAAIKLLDDTSVGSTRMVPITTPDELIRLTNVEPQIITCRRRL